MSSKTEYHVFISHHHEDQEDLDRLKELMKEKGYNMKDSSIDESKPNKAENEEYIKSLLRTRIDWSGTLVVLIGKETHTRPWVDWEIEYAHRQGKRIVGIFAHDGKDSDVPQNLDKYGDDLVGWGSKNLIAAIKGEHDGPWESPDSTPRPASHAAGRSKC